MTMAARDATASVLGPPRVSGRTAAPPHGWRLSAGGPTLADLVRVVLTLTLVGALVLAAQLVVEGRGGGTADDSVLRTDSGWLEVGDVTVSAAVPAADKGMVGKGPTAHSGAAASAGVRVNVPITLQNDSDAAVGYRPAQFRLDAGSGSAVGPQDNALLTGTLRPGAAVSLRLTFSLPAAPDRARLLVAGGASEGLDLHLPGADATGRQMTPQDSAPAPAPADGHGH